MSKGIMKNFLFLLIVFVAACQSKQTPADLIIRGGTIYTMDQKLPQAEAVAVRGDTIVFVGNEEEVNSFKGEQTKMIDLNGATMTPGFIESHGHIMGLGYSELNLDLTAIKSYDEMVDLVRDAVEKSQPGQWILGRGWHQDKW